MAIGYMKQSEHTTAYLNSYVADTEADVATLPTGVAPGSTCVVIASGNIYMLNNNHQWILFGGSSGGSGGGTVEGEFWEPFEGAGANPGGTGTGSGGWSPFG